MFSSDDEKIAEIKATVKSMLAERDEKIKAQAEEIAQLKAELQQVRSDAHAVLR